MFFRILRNISFSENVFFSQKKAPAASRRAQKKNNVIFQLKKGACGKPEGTQKKLMSFFSRKRRLRQAGGHTKKVLSNINNTRTRQEQGVENSQNIQEKTGFDYNFNIVLSILNINNFNNISFF